jgi:hypothetical protein
MAHGVGRQARAGDGGLHGGGGELGVGHVFQAAAEGADGGAGGADDENVTVGHVKHEVGLQHEREARAGGHAVHLGDDGGVQLRQQRHGFVERRQQVARALHGVGTQRGQVAPGHEALARAAQHHAAHAVVLRRWCCTASRKAVAMGTSMALSAPGRLKRSVAMAPWRSSSRGGGVVAVMFAPETRAASACW